MKYNSEMKKTIIYAITFLLSMTFAGCGDFFNPDTDDELNGNDYISSKTEMYTGFLCIMTKLQAGEFLGGEVVLHNKSREEVFRKIKQYENHNSMFSFRFAGRIPEGVSILL